MTARRSRTSSLLINYRHGTRSRSQVVREAIMWLRAKEAGWLLRARRHEQLEAERAAKLEAALKHNRQERDRQATEHTVESALAIARTGATGRVGSSP